MYLVSLLLTILISLFDNSVSTFLLLLLIYFVVVLYSQTIPKDYRRKWIKGLNFIYSIYILIAFIVSFSFSSTDYFFVSDSSRYIESYLQSRSLHYDNEDFYKCYFEFSDSNVLYNSYINIMAMLANNHVGGMTVYGMTLLQTLWGILSSIVLFRILSRHIKVERAYRYTLIFSLCSLFLFYSTVIIRDIVICFFYLCAFDIIDRDFSILGVIKLLLLIILTWGVRLYSGIFLIAFLAYYIYVRFRNSQIKTIATILFAIVIIAAGVSLMSSSLIEQTTAELQGYEELSAERSAGGVISKLQSLPPGLSHLAIVLFTMIKPLPPFGVYIEVGTFSQFTMSTLFLIAGFFWFVIFFSFCYRLFFKKHLIKIPFESVALLIVCLVFLMANASHPDIRRMLPVFPIAFVQYAIFCEQEGETLFEGRIPKLLMSLYATLAIGTLFIL